MSRSQSDPPPESAEAGPVATLRALRARLVGVHAANLAYGGRLEEADALLAPLAAADSAPPELLDLAARVRAQRGLLDDAEGLWTRALEREPDNARYQAGLRRVERARDEPPWLRRALLAAGSAVVILTLSAAVVLGIRLVNHAQPSPRPRPTIERPVRPTPTETASSTGRLPSLSPLG